MSEYLFRLHTDMTEKVNLQCQVKCLDSSGTSDKGHNRNSLNKRIFSKSKYLITTAISL